jgi:hypothetical protein
MSRRQSITFRLTLLFAAASTAPNRAKQVWRRMGNPGAASSRCAAPAMANAPPPAGRGGHRHFPSPSTSWRRSARRCGCSSPLPPPGNGLLGWVAVRRGLAPLRAMRAKAGKVTASASTTA